MPFYVKPADSEMGLQDSAVLIGDKVWPIAATDKVFVKAAGWMETVIDFVWPACPETQDILRPKLSPGALRPAALGSWAPWTVRPMTDGDVQLVSEWKLEVAEPFSRSRQ